MRRQFKRLCCFFIWIVTSTGAFVTVNRRSCCSSSCDLSSPYRIATTTITTTGSSGSPYNPNAKIYHTVHLWVKESKTLREDDEDDAEKDNKKNDKKDENEKFVSNESSTGNWFRKFFSSSSSSSNQKDNNTLISKKDKVLLPNKQNDTNDSLVNSFFRRNKSVDAVPIELSSSTKRLSKDDNKKKQQKQKQQKQNHNTSKKDSSKQNTNKNIQNKKDTLQDKKRSETKDEVKVISSRPVRNFVSGLFATSSNTNSNSSSSSNKTEKISSPNPTDNSQSRKLFSGLWTFSSDNNNDDDDDDDNNKQKTKKKNQDMNNNNNNKEEESENSISNMFSTVQRFFANSFASFNNSNNNNMNNNNNDQEQWVPVFPKTRLSPGEIVPATIGGIDLLVIASKDGRKLYCIANSCSHLGTPLETGKLVRLPIVEGSTTTTTTSSGNEITTTNMDNKEATNRSRKSSSFTETEVSAILQQDGLEDCIVCPLHRTAFALKSGEVRGEWCPYPPIVGKLVGTVKPPTSVATFDIRTKGKQIEVRINSLLEE